MPVGKKTYGVRLYSCFTPSHRPLLDWHFLPSLPEPRQALSSGSPPGPQVMSSDLVIREPLQRSVTCAFASDGFQRTCLDKVDVILEALARETEAFLFSDVDVRFYRPVVEDLLKCLGDADMAFQWDGPRGRECTGFMVMRTNDRTLSFWELVPAAPHPAAGAFCLHHPVRR
jgi:hypothetical protein